MRVLILALVLGATVIFWVQNQQIVTLVFFGGIMTVKLPLALWVILFTGVGLLTSLLWQFLNYLSSSLNPAPRIVEAPKTKPVPPPPPSRPARTEPAQPEPWQKTEPEDDWDIETPPPKPIQPKEEVERRLPEDDRSTSFEVQQDPKTVSRSGSVYSYTYREPRTPKREIEDKTDRVYDADYRVITPPYQETSKPRTDSEDDEDWV